MPDGSRKSESEGSASSGRFVFVEDTGAVKRPRTPLPVLSVGDASVLDAFLEKACSSPHDWHRLPGSTLVLRAIPVAGAHRAFCFEVRDDRLPGEIRRYRYERTTRTLAYRNDHEIEPFELPSEHRLPRDIEQFALSVVAFIDARPESPYLSYGFAGAGFREGAVAQSCLQEPSPIRNAFADIIRRLANQWFGPAAHDWSFTKRFLCAGAGSATFFLALIFIQILRENLKLLIDPFYLPTILSAYLILFVLSAWFAWLVSWRDVQYGPIRLYLSGFLLPYFVWWLVDKLPIVGQ